MCGVGVEAGDGDVGWLNLASGEGLELEHKSLAVVSVIQLALLCRSRQSPICAEELFTACLKDTQRVIYIH